MKAIIFCAGKGKRILDITKDEIPKPLISINGKNILEHLLDLLKRHEVTEVILVVHHLKEKIIEFFGTGEKHGIKISYIPEEQLLGNVGHLSLAKDQLKGTFIAGNGDELKDIDLEDMLKQHKENKAMITIAIKEVEDPSSYGVVKLDGSKITGFVEKPKKEEAPSNFINSGLYIIEPEALNHNFNDLDMIERTLFPKLAQEGKLFGYKFKGQWFDTGTPERYEEAKRNWKGVRPKI